MLRNSTPNTDAFANGKRFRLELAGINLCRLTPEFVVTKAEAGRRRRELKEMGIVAHVFGITEDGGLRQ